MHTSITGICNEKGVFIDVSIGSPGRMHDARVFRLSPIFAQLSNVQNFLPAFHHLIGDSGYPLLRNLMKPYQDNGHLRRDQQIYNNKLSSIRSIIERAFGLLKTKFRRLRFSEVNEPDTANRIVMTCCVLHNFLLKQNNNEDDYLPEEIYHVDGLPDGINNEIINDDAEHKRQTIVNLCAN